MASIRQRGRSYYFRFTDGDGVKRELRSCADLRETERMAALAEMEAAKIRAGIFDSKDLARRDHQARSLSERLTAWRDAMLDQRHTEKHTSQSTERVRRLIAVMFGAQPDDIDGKTMKRSQQKRARATIDRLVTKGRLSDITTDRCRPRWRRSESRADQPKRATTTDRASARSPAGRGRSEGCAMPRWSA